MKITDAVSFGAAIRSRRKELKYTQSYIADSTGISISFLSDLENGKETCELGRALYIMNLLGLDCTLSERSSI